MIRHRTAKLCYGRRYGQITMMILLILCHLDASKHHYNAEWLSAIFTLYLDINDDILSIDGLVAINSNNSKWN